MAAESLSSRCFSLTTWLCSFISFWLNSGCLSLVVTVARICVSFSLLYDVSQFIMLSLYISCFLCPECLFPVCIPGFIPYCPPLHSLKPSCELTHPSRLSTEVMSLTFSPGSTAEFRASISLLRTLRAFVTLFLNCFPFFFLPTRHKLLECRCFMFLSLASSRFGPIVFSMPRRLPFKKQEIILSYTPSQGNLSEAQISTSLSLG